ncbi:MAG: winged helix-turn-helix transcriptional regulator [Actinobacteria bacterium]|nr:winged helix-turn-helix transcriptional regulator [Actinomycetota bacterium]
MLELDRDEGFEGGRDPVDVQAFAAGACLFHSLSDPNRVAMLFFLATGEQRVVDVTKHLSLAQSTVSKHLACLKDCGLVVSRPVGRASVYSLKHPELVRGVLEAAEALLAATDDAVLLCENFGVAAHPGQ